MNNDDLGKLIYESPSSSIARKFVGIVYITIFLIASIIFSVGPFFFESFEWRYINFIGFPFFLFLAVYMYHYWVKERIRIYQNGFSGPTFKSSYFPLWPKPVHVNDIVGYWLHKDLTERIRCDILLNNGKIKKIWSNSFNNKTRLIFKYYILKKLPRLSQTEFQKNQEQIKAKH
jgi:hypothetical protein